MDDLEKVTAAMRVFHDLWPYDDGPGHIVYGDFNLRDGDLEACISCVDAGETFSSEHDDPADPIFVATRAVLAYLLDVPEVIRLAWAEHGHEYVWGYGLGAGHAGNSDSVELPAAS